jgi:DUF1680 family protein
VGKEKPQTVRSGTYAVLDRMWTSGDTVRLRLRLRMPVRAILPRSVTTGTGQTVLARGRLVCCLEQQHVASNRRISIWRPATLCAERRCSGRAVQLKLVPFYAHANRGDDNL